MLTSKGMIAFALAGITMIFLSSVVPVAAQNPFSGARSFEVSMEKEFPTTQQEPVLYTDFDISKELHPWLDIMVMHLTIDAFDRMKAAEEAEAEAARRLANADKFVWDVSGWAYISVGLLLFAVSGFIFYAALKRFGV